LKIGALVGPFICQKSPWFSTQDRELVSKAINLAGIEHMEENILAKVSTRSARDHRPLVALLLACLPNVSTIYAHVPESDPYLHAVLLAATKKPLFAKLESIYIPAEVPVFELDAPLFRSSSDYYPALKLDVLWPVLYLPNLNSMYLYNLDTEGLSDLLRNVRGSRVCNIKDFSIATHKESKALVEDVHALLTLPSTLRSVSLYWHNYKFKTGPAKKDVSLKISNEQV
jgi:hypothetical protein